MGSLPCRLESRPHTSAMGPAVLCLMMAGAALAQVPTTCPGPKQFEVRFSREDRERRMRVSGAIAYDGPGQRVAEFEDELVGATHAIYRKLYLYNEKKEYTVDIQTKNCTVGPPRRPNHPYGVPPDSKFAADFVIGASGVAGEHLTVASFDHQFGNDSFFVVVTEPSCFPVLQGFKGPDGIVDMMNFYDAQEGIRSPDVFDIPKECAGL